MHKSRLKIAQRETIKEQHKQHEIVFVSVSAQMTV